MMLVRFFVYYVFFSSYCLLFFFLWPRLPIFLPPLLLFVESTIALSLMGSSMMSPMTAVATKPPCFCFPLSSRRLQRCNHVLPSARIISSSFVVVVVVVMTVAVAVA